MKENHLERREISSLGQRHVWEYIILLLLLVLGFAFRTLPLEAQGLWRDEVDQLRFALAPLSNILQNFVRAGWNGPLYLLILRGWIALTGTSVYAMRYLSTLWSMISLTLLYKLGARRLGHPAAYYALGLAVCSPYFIWYAQEVKMYTWVPMLALLALYALDRASTRPRWYWWVTVLGAVSLGMYSHILFALAIPVACVWCLLHPNRSPHVWRGAGAVLGLLTLPYLPLVNWIFPMLKTALLEGNANTGYPSYNLRQAFKILLDAWSSGVVGWKHQSAALVFGLLAVWGSLSLVHKQRKLGLLASLWIWLSLPPLSVWLISLRRPMFTDRYFIWCMPAFYLLVSQGLAALKRLHPGVPLLCLSALLTLNSGNIYRQITTPIKPEFPKAAAYLERHRGASDCLLFQIPYNHIVLDYYYTPPLLPWNEAPYTNWRKADGSYLKGEAYVDAEMQRLTQGCTSMWLIYSEAKMWDERELVKIWLNTHGQQLDAQHFHQVEVYHYELTEAVPHDD